MSVGKNFPPGYVPWDGVERRADPPRPTKRWDLGEFFSGVLVGMLLSAMALGVTRWAWGVWWLGVAD